jgi:tetratricopeptide (TPR) repeat protein
MLKTARTLSKEGKHDESFRAYASLFSSAAFQASKPEDQHAVLKMMVHAKVPATVTPSADSLAAHKAALPALQALVVSRRDPADYEMLGMAYVVLGEEAKALEIFKKALEIERARSPGSDLCGDLMRRVSQL